ncbi:histidine phosphatase family containing protein [Ceratobasidium sp. AG-Ba]|nr:histidine phosphatase family containing protein [Ceratobasidium sp. AG-Ba]
MSIKGCVESPQKRARKLTGHNLYALYYVSTQTSISIGFAARLVVALAAATLLAFVAYTLSNPAKSALPSSGARNAAWPSMPSYSLSPEVAHNLGAYAARYVVPGPISTEVPSGCNVSMISILQRHGARYPIEESSVAIQKALSKARSARNITNPLLKFVPGFSYPNQSEQLVPFGRNQFISGQIIAAKYAALGNSSFVRSAPLERVVNLPDGGDKVSTAVSPMFRFLTCPAQTLFSRPKAFPKPGDVKSKEWIPHFVPSITRFLNDGLHGANLDDKDTIHLMDLCGFDTAFKNGTASPWCSVFNTIDFENYEYLRDLREYYSNSMVLQADLYTTIHDQRNLGCQSGDLSVWPVRSKIFADFSSDNDITKILSGLGILRGNTPLPADGPIPTNRQFYVSKIVPFAGQPLLKS